MDGCCNWENVRPSTLGLLELGGPKMPSHFFPIEILGVDQRPILQNSKSETPHLSDLCLDYKREGDLTCFFWLVAEFRARSLNGDGNDDDAKFKNPKAAVRRP